MTEDEKFMTEALRQAQLAAKYGEVPVGAVIVQDEKIIASAFNRRETNKSALAHAEVLAIEQACQKCGGWHLTDCTLYVTLEPCPMCAGAAINARLKRVVFGAKDSKNGCCGSLADLFSMPFTHQPDLTGGVSEHECQAALTSFFQSRRLENAQTNRHGIIIEAGTLIQHFSETERQLWNTLLQSRQRTVTVKQWRTLAGKHPYEIAKALCSGEQDEELQQLSSDYQNCLHHSLKHDLTLQTDAKEVLSRLQQQYTVCLLLPVSQEGTDCLSPLSELCITTDPVPSSWAQTYTKSSQLRHIMKKNRLTKAVYFGRNETDRAAADTAGIPYLHAGYCTEKVSSCTKELTSLSELTDVIKTIF